MTYFCLMASTATKRSGTLIERAVREVARGSDGSGPVDRTRSRLLDAAYDQFCETGISSTSMEEVAKRAGTARITIYRKFDSKDSLVDAVMLREFSGYIAAFRDEIMQSTTVEDRVIATFVTSLRTVGGNPLIKRLLETEPEMLPGLVGGGDGRTMGEVRDFVARPDRAGTAGRQHPGVGVDKPRRRTGRPTLHLDDHHAQ